MKKLITIILTLTLLLCMSIPCFAGTWEGILDTETHIGNVFNPDTHNTGIVCYNNSSSVGPVQFRVNGSIAGVPAGGGYTFSGLGVVPIYAAPISVWGFRSMTFIYFIT